MSELLQRPLILGNSFGAWLLAIAAFLVCFFVLPALRAFVVSRSRQLRGGDTPASIELTLLLIARTHALFLWVVALWVGERFLELPARLEKISDTVMVLALWIQAALWAVAAAELLLRQRQERLLAEGEIRQSGSISMLLFLARGVIFSLAALLALDNLGVNITALVAGLGIGGIAIALAVQTILGDLLASLSITLDKPFRAGDLLKLDDIEGVVELIGLRSTRLRSVSGEQIIVANADLLKSRVRNLGRMPERRVLFRLGIAYETPPEAVARVGELVGKAVASVEGTRFEFCALLSFGESALGFEVMYFVPGWDEAPFRFVHINDAVNQAIHAALSAQGIRLAYPTRTVLLKQ